MELYFIVFLVYYNTFLENLLKFCKYRYTTIIKTAK